MTEVFDGGVDVESTIEFELQVSRGLVPRHRTFRVVGQNPDIDIADGYADIWAGKLTGTQKFVPPTQARIHDFVSNDVADTGGVVSSGSVGSATSTTLVDRGADFVADGVAIGDLIFDDTSILIGKVIAVAPTVLTIISWFNPSDGLRIDIPSEMSSYRVVSPSSTGAGAVHIEGLDAAFNSQEEFLVLNGTTPVATLKLWSRMNRIRGIGTGSSHEVVGEVTATAQTDNTVTAAIIDGDNVSLTTVFTVPLDKDGFLIRWSGALAKKTAGIANVRLRIGPTDGTAYVYDVIDLNSAGSANFERCLGYSRLPGGVDILVEADVDSNDMSVSAGFDIILVDI